MAKITVQKPFVYNSQGGVKTPFGVGVHEVEDSVAEHWFTQAHCATMEDGKAVPKKTTTKKK